MAGCTAPETRIILVSAFPDFSLGIAGLVAGLEQLSSRGMSLRWIVRDYSRAGTEVTSRFVRDLLLFEPDVIGFSCFFWNLDEVLRLVRLAKSLRPGVLTVLGGPQVGAPEEAARLLAEHEGVDVTLCGEADLTFAELVEKHGEGTDLVGIPGAVFRDGDAVRSSPGGRAQAELAVLPRVLHQGNPYVRARTSRWAMLSLETLRGCRRSCSYCLYCSGALRYYPLQRVERELEYVLGGGIRHLRICDSHLGGTRARALEILSLIAHHNIQTTVTVFPDPEHVDDEYAELLARAGCRVVSLGVETLDPEVAAKVGRRLDPARVAEAIAVLRRHGQSVQGDLMFGLPGQGAQSLGWDVDALERMGAHRVLLSPLMVFPGTLLARELEERGVEVLPSAQGYGYDRAGGLAGLAEQLRVVEATRLRSLLPETVRLLRENGALPLAAPEHVTAALEFLEGSSTALRDGIEEATDRCLAALGVAAVADARESLRLDVLTLAMLRSVAEAARSPEGLMARPRVFFRDDLASMRWRLDPDVWLGCFHRRGADEHYLFNGRSGVRERLGESEARSLAALAAAPAGEALDAGGLPRLEHWIRSGALVPADPPSHEAPPLVPGDYDCYALHPPEAGAPPESPTAAPPGSSCSR